MQIAGLLRIIDWFVPDELRTNTASLWRSRIFAFSHLSGPLLGAVIMIYLFHAEAQPGIPFYTICILVVAFLALPFAMKLTGQFFWVALFSICDLAFIGVFGSFFYGGVSSPFMPWFLVALLLGFFYLGERPALVLGIFAVDLLGFVVAYAANGSFPEIVPIAGLSGVGVTSVCAATVYTSMMAIYYANVLTAQSELRQEIERHLVTAEKMRQAKGRADRASDAKAAFLCKMSHQLRTPLNAVIGYSNSAGRGRGHRRCRANGRSQQDQSCRQAPAFPGGRRPAHAEDRIGQYRGANSTLRSGAVRRRCRIDLPESGDAERK